LASIVAPIFLDVDSIGCCLVINCGAADNTFEFAAPGGGGIIPRGGAPGGRGMFPSIRPGIPAERVDKFSADQQDNLKILLF
jgi:hypothetical protein